jgi:hypothetical protein
LLIEMLAANTQIAKVGLVRGDGYLTAKLVPVAVGDGESAF